MPEDALKLVTLRNGFYRDNYRKALSALMVLLVINILLIGVIIYQLTHVPEPTYFATTTDGKIIPLQPLSQPVVTQSALLEWVTRAATSAYTYNYVNYRKELQVASQYFTQQGWQNFTETLKNTRNLETVLSKKLVVSAEPTAAPTVVNQGLVGDAYAWQIRIPLLVTFQSAAVRFQQAIEVTMMVMRVSNLDQPEGIAIQQFVASERPLA